jgi:hypothetical protein
MLPVDDWANTCPAMPQAMAMPITSMVRLPNEPVAVNFCCFMNDSPDLLYVI